MASKSGGGGGSGSSSGGEGQRITWDEETIAEHDKLRGTRSKIVEADTPYIVYDEDGDTAVEKRAAAPGTSRLFAPNQVLYWKFPKLGWTEWQLNHQKFGGLLQVSLITVCATPCA